MTYISANLVLVRFRQQFGLRLYAMLGLTSFDQIDAGRQLLSARMIWAAWTPGRRSALGISSKRSSSA